MTTKLLRCVATAAIGTAIVTATPGFGAGVEGGGLRFVGGSYNRAGVRHHRHFRNFAFVGGALFYSYGGYGNYCWQQVWTPTGWQWVDVCPGYHGYTY